MESSSENILPISFAFKPNEESSLVRQLESECAIKDKRIYELEEVISRQTRQLTQLSEGLLDLRSEMDPEIGQRQMHRIDMLENRLSASLQHEHSLEQQLTEFELKMNDCYEVQCGLSALTLHYQKLRESNKCLRENFQASLNRLSFACELVSCSSHQAALTRHHSSQLSANDSNEHNKQGIRKTCLADGECFSADEWIGEGRSDCLFGSCSSEPVTHERKYVDKGTQINVVPSCTPNKFSPEVLKQSSLVVARIVNSRSQPEKELHASKPQRENLLSEEELSAPAYMLDLQTVQLLLERERRLRLRDRLQCNPKSTPSGNVLRSISQGKFRIGTSVVYDFTHNTRW